MFSSSISLLTLLVIHFGFAALLGALLNRVKTVTDGFLFTFLAILYLFATFTLPLPWWGNVLVLLGSFFLASLSAARIPRSIFRPRNGWLYAGLAMLLVLTWSSAQGWQYPMITLGAAAGLAALLALRRGLQTF